MGDNVRLDNRRALPKYLLTILLFGAAGRRAGLFHRCGWGRWRGGDGAAGPGLGAGGGAPFWGIVGSAVVLLRRAGTSSAAAKRRFRLGWGGRGRHGLGGAAAELGSAADGLVIILTFSSPPPSST